MTTTIGAPPPEPVREKFSSYAPALRPVLLRLRDLIFATAAETKGVGPLTETLKWGEPSYLTEATGAGTTLRLAPSKDGEGASLFVNCRTTLVDEWRTRYGDELTLIGTRELRLDPASPFPEEILRQCIAMALTYHLRKSAS
ncbi:DUF1801 domain-containing protein [Parvularcula marina]|uniref:DUF1801 domain-containing protein n=1 Tax=Parvularcula marina TaxID=2292771 RepID=UPI003514E97F